MAKTRSAGEVGDSAWLEDAEEEVFNFNAPYAYEAGAVTGMPAHAAYAWSSPKPTASLREDDLNQVQRDSLSPLLGSRGTPSELPRMWRRDCACRPCKKLAMQHPRSWYALSLGNARGAVV